MVCLKDWSRDLCFNLFTNNLEMGISSKVAKFVDDTKPEVSILGCCSAPA